MDEVDALLAGTVTVNSDTVITYTTISNTVITYNQTGGDGDVPADASTVLDNVFVGKWQVGDDTHEFRASGALVISGAGETAEYSYLVRKDRLVTLARKQPHVVEEFIFTVNGNTITVNPAGEGTPLIYTPHGE
jgi:hypothetical protein